MTIWFWILKIFIRGKPREPQQFKLLQLPFEIVHQCVSAARAEKVASVEEPARSQVTTETTFNDRNDHWDIKCIHKLYWYYTIKIYVHTHKVLDYLHESNFSHFRTLKTYIYYVFKISKMVSNIDTLQLRLFFTDKNYSPRTHIEIAFNSILHCLLYRLFF